MSTTVVPGPCPAEGCPVPTQIDCVEVNKVYDFCVQSDTKDIMFPIPASCGTVPPGSTISGTVTSVSCTVVANVPILNASGQPTGFANITLLVSAMESITITSPTGTTLCTFEVDQVMFTKTIVLCAPAGTTITCHAVNTSVGPCAFTAGQIMCTVNLCLLIQSEALVKLLVPTYGFCTPAPCVVSPSPPFVCPPSPIFPPQCTVPPATTTQSIVIVDP